MKKFLLFTGIFWSVFTLKSQVQTTAPKKYWVYLEARDQVELKKSKPALSSKSLQRRANQHIALTESDFAVSTSYIHILQSAGIKILGSSRWFNAVIVSCEGEAEIKTLKEFSFVKEIQAVKTYRMKGNNPEDGNTAEEQKTAASVEKTLSNTYDYGQSLNQIQQLNGVCMHNQGFDGKNMEIAVLDAGFLNYQTVNAFDTIRNNNQILSIRDLVSNDGSVNEDHSHGTSVLSCMAGNIPGSLVGTAPKAKFHLVRTEDANSERIVEESYWVLGAEYADSIGANIINSSLGYTTFDIPSEDHVYADLNGQTSVASKAATIAARKGMIVCNSAGNEGNNTWHYIGIPADADSILTVGAVDGGGIRTGFSSVGPTADGRIKPTIMAQGSQTQVCYPGSNTINGGAGTSFSSPVLCGMVACLWQANPSKTNMELINAIIYSGDRYGNPDNEYGYGIPNFCKADSILKGLISIKPVNETSLLLISPNPFSTDLKFSIISPSNTQLTYKICDIQGKILLEEKISLVKDHEKIIEITGIEELPSGMYFFMANFDNFTLQNKLIKINR